MKKITIVYNEPVSVDQQLKIESAKYLSDFVIRIRFNNGRERITDFKPFLSNSYHPSIRKYLDESEFSNFSILDGNLNWNDYELIFPIWDLYNGLIDKRVNKNI